jgi:hypothetical protein
MAIGTGRTDQDRKSSLRMDEPIATDWELPSLHFRPLSFMNYSQGVAERSRSSGPRTRLNAPTILSPTPERPMSSQSRRRFSKILEVDDSGHSPVHGPRSLSRSHTSPTAGKLKRVLEASEKGYPAKYSIPAFSPRNSIIAESTRDNESNVGSTDHEHESGCEKSTVESLLDKHIECLGLQPETVSAPVEEQEVFGDDGTQASTVSTSREESTVRIALEPAPESRPRAQTINPAHVSTTAGPEQQIMMPRRLFSPGRPRGPTLAAGQSSPCVSDPSVPKPFGRPSIGWNTLTSASNLSSNDPTLSQRIIDSAQPNEHDGSPKAEAKPLSMTRLSPSTSSCWSGGSEDLYNWDDDVLTNQRSRQRLLERQISQRRRTRMRLKLKRSSHSRPRICASELSSAHESFHTARAPSQDRVSVLGPLSKPDATTSGSHDGMHNESRPVNTTQATSPQPAWIRSPPATSPDIPNRRSSVVAIATQKMKNSVDMARKMSVRTMRSHRSNASIVEPLNSTRLSAVAPHLGAPDLGPPLTSTSLNMNFAFPPAAVAAPAGLRATQSFFSDDSSAVQNPRASLRERFNLPSLRSVLPSSPRVHSMANAPGRHREAAHSRLHQSCQMQGLTQEGEESDLYGTVGMSEFAYCRRRMLERVKGWWKRTSIQRKLGLKRRMSERYSSQGH